MLVVTPPSPEIMGDPTALRTWVSNMPVSANLLLAAGYALGSFAGGFTATKVAGSGNGALPSILVGVLLTAVGFVNFFMTMPGSPMWAIVLCLAIYIPFAWLGHRAARVS